MDAVGHMLPGSSAYTLKRQRFHFYVSFRILIDEIRFTRNDYFLKDSRYTIYQKRNSRNKIKSMKEISDVNQLARLSIDEKIKIYAWLSQSLQGKYSESFKPTSRRIVIRQITQIDRYEQVYRNVGYIDLPLHELVKLKRPTSFIVPLIDEDDGAEAKLKIRVEVKVKINPYAPSFFTRMGSSLYTFIFPHKHEDIIDRLTQNKVLLQILRNRDNSEYRDVILLEDREAELREEMTRIIRENIRLANEGKAIEFGSGSNDEELVLFNQSSDIDAYLEEDLAAYHFSEEDYAEDHDPQAGGAAGAPQGRPQMLLKQISKHVSQRRFEREQHQQLQQQEQQPAVMMPKGVIEPVSQIASMDKIQDQQAYSQQYNQQYRQQDGQQVVQQFASRDENQPTVNEAPIPQRHSKLIRRLGDNTANTSDYTGGSSGMQSASTGTGSAGSGGGGFQAPRMQYPPQQQQQQASYDYQHSGYTEQGQQQYQQGQYQQQANNQPPPRVVVRRIASGGSATINASHSPAPAPSAASPYSPYAQQQQQDAAITTSGSRQGYTRTNSGQSYQYQDTVSDTGTNTNTNTASSVQAAVVRKKKTRVGETDLTNDGTSSVASSAYQQPVVVRQAVRSPPSAASPVSLAHPAAKPEIRPGVEYVQPSKPAASSVTMANSNSNQIMTMENGNHNGSFTQPRRRVSRIGESATAPSDYGSNPNGGSYFNAASSTSGFNVNNNGSNYAIQPPPSAAQLPQQQQPPRVASRRIVSRVGSSDMNGAGAAGSRTLPLQPLGSNQRLVSDPYAAGGQGGMMYQQPQMNQNGGIYGAYSVSPSQQYAVGGRQPYYAQQQMPHQQPVAYGMYPQYPPQQSPQAMQQQQQQQQYYDGFYRGSFHE